MSLYNRFFTKFAVIFFSFLFLCSNPALSLVNVSVSAAEITSDDINNARLAIHVSSNDIPGWPQGPATGSESAILMDADTGVVLYAKNEHELRFPASTTKVMTCLLAAENSTMDEMVTFSKEAVFGIERGSSNVGMDVGQKITMEEALYCIMLSSANEVAAAVAEHIGGTIDGFCDMMNERALELGCLHTHFCNANGLPNDEHLTTAYDLALISQAFNKNDALRRIAGTNTYTINATPTQPDTFTMKNHHKMYPNNNYSYEWVTWGKTGYTNVARETLVTCAEKDGLNLICVVMKGEPPYQYTDTRDLFEYGFNNFKKVNIADEDKRYQIDSSDFFDTDAAIYGDTKPLLTLDRSGFCMIPKSAELSDLESVISYDLEDDEPNAAADAIASISYFYNGYFVGKTYVKANDSDVEDFAFGRAVTEGQLPGYEAGTAEGADAASTAKGGKRAEGATDGANSSDADNAVISESGASASDEQGNASEANPEGSEKKPPENAETVSTISASKGIHLFGRNKDGKPLVIFVNIRKLVIGGSIILGILITVVVLLVLFRTNRYASRRRRSIRKRNRRYVSEFDHFDF